MVYYFLPMAFFSKEGFGQRGFNEALQVIKNYDFCPSRYVNIKVSGQVFLMRNVSAFNSEFKYSSQPTVRNASAFNSEFNYSSRPTVRNVSAFNNEFKYSSRSTNGNISALNSEFKYSSRPTVRSVSALNSEFKYSSRSTMENVSAFDKEVQVLLMANHEECNCLTKYFSWRTVSITIS